MFVERESDLLDEAVVEVHVGQVGVRGREPEGTIGSKDLL